MQRRKQSKPPDSKPPSAKEPLTDDVNARILQGTYREREAAIRDAKKRGDKSATEALMKTLLIDGKTDSEASMEEVDLSMSAAEALGAIGLDEEQFQKLIGIVEKGEKDERIRALNGLSWTGDKRALSLVIKEFETADDDSRENAAYRLENFDDREALEALVKALHDPNSEISSVSYESIGCRDDSVIRSVLPILIDAVLKGDFDMRYDCAYRIASVGVEEQLDYLMEMLENGTGEQKAGSAMILGCAKHEDAEQLVIKGLKDKLISYQRPDARIEKDDFQIDCFLSAIRDIGSSYTEKELEEICDSPEFERLPERTQQIILHCSIELDEKMRKNEDPDLQ